MVTLETNLFNQYAHIYSDGKSMLKGVKKFLA